MACQEFRKEVDAVFPEHMSRLHRGATALDHPSSYRRHQRRVLHRETTAGAVSGRYRTQPVTFDEIKEVDEEVSEEIRHAADMNTSSAGASVAQSEEDLMQQKFNQIRLRRRGSAHRSSRRPFLRSSSSHDEIDNESHCSPSSAQPPQSLPS